MIAPAEAEVDAAREHEAFADRENPVACWTSNSEQHLAAWRLHVAVATLTLRVSIDNPKYRCLYLRGLTSHLPFR